MVSRGRIAPTATNASRAPDRFDQCGGDDRTERDAPHREAPDDSEDAGQDPVWDESLQQREGSDVLDAVGCTDDREHEESEGELGQRAHEGDRQSPEHQGDAERHRQTLPSERHRSERTDQATDAERGRHVADGFSASRRAPGTRRPRSGRSGSRGRRPARRSARRRAERAATARSRRTPPQEHSGHSHRAHPGSLDPRP